MKNSDKPTYHIIPGFGEGKYHIQCLATALERLGYAASSDAAGADILIAHSGGCLDLPADTGGKLVILADPSVTPGVPALVRAMLVKVWTDAQECARQHRLRRWAAKTFWNLMYIFSRTVHNWRMTRLTLASGRRLPAVAGRTVVISHHRDPWRWLIGHDEPVNRGYVFVTYQGSHDQLWLEPADFASVVQSWYESAS